MKFNFDDYKGNYVMQCKTEEEAEDFCRVMHEAGRSWNSGDKYIDDSKWHFNKEETCYNFNGGTRDSEYYFKETGWIILEWSDFMGFTKADLKDGMVGITRNGNKYVLLNGRFMNNTDGIHPDNLNEDLTTSKGHGKYDIIRICRSTATTLDEYFDDGYFITKWERPAEITEMTIGEIRKALNIAGELKIKEDVK